jgi:hypothetical protein
VWTELRYGVIQGGPERSKSDAVDRAKGPDSRCWESAILPPDLVDSDPRRVYSYIVGGRDRLPTPAPRERDES